MGLEMCIRDSKMCAWCKFGFVRGKRASGTCGLVSIVKAGVCREACVAIEFDILERRYF